MVLFEENVSECVRNHYGVLVLELFFFFFLFNFEWRGSGYISWYRKWGCQGVLGISLLLMFNKVDSLNE